MRLVDFKMQFGLETISESEEHLFHNLPSLTFMQPEVANHEEIYREQLYSWLEYVTNYVGSNQHDTSVVKNCRALLFLCYQAYKSVRQELKETDLNLLQNYFYRVACLVAPSIEQEVVEPVTSPLEELFPEVQQYLQQTTPSTAGTSSQSFFSNRPADDSWAMTNFINEIKCYPEQYRESLLRGLFALLQPLNAQDPANATDYFYITAISRARRGIITDLLAHESAWSTIVGFLKSIPVVARLTYLSRLPEGNNSFNFANLESRVRVSMLDFDAGNVPSAPRFNLTAI